ncbi:MAG: hypothetical protein JNK94_06620 [Hyphomonadaceae bacterium]|nr:hypothetical protein [Hyphomonadaceae bacterium]MBX3510255.1 hypothetical protein [Hyphomonadaceae bacterium]
MRVLAPETSWTTFPEAERVVSLAIEEACVRAPILAALAERLRTLCALRLCDVVESLAGPFAPETLQKGGWLCEREGRVLGQVWRHASPYLPDMIVSARMAIVLRAERIEALLDALELDAPVEGAAFGPFRRTKLAGGGEVDVLAVERNGGRGLFAPALGARKERRGRLHQQIFRTRRRQFRAPEGGLDHLERLVEVAAADLGPDWACALFLRAEREYFTANCAPAALQQRRQERAGVGWANIDHYAYCTSREFLPAAARILSKLGFVSAGRIDDDGHDGALVLVQPTLRCAVMLEFDQAGAISSLDDVASLTWRYQAGLWAALHGESLLEGGLRYLAARCDVSAMAEHFSRDGVAVEPVSDAVEHLVQVAAAPPPRAVYPRRVDELERAGYLTPAAAETYRLSGAPAAHFRALARVEAYNGFAPPDYGAASALVVPDGMPPPTPKRRRMRVRQLQR